MLALNLPTYAYKIVRQGDKQYIFDVLRKKYVTLTPEEWVRQHFINYLIDWKGYPQGLLVNEIQISLNGMRKRCDTILYKRDLSAAMIIEYKAPNVKISQSVFEQITRYNMALRVKYLIVTNGMFHYCCKIDYKRQQYTFLPSIPQYDTLEL